MMNISLINKCLTSGLLVLKGISNPGADRIFFKLFFSFIFSNPFSFADEDLEGLLDEVIRASNRGVSASRNVSGGPNWSFGQSLFFSSTVVTTIGRFFDLTSNELVVSSMCLGVYCTEI